MDTASHFSDIFQANEVARITTMNDQVF
ncbi:hypothetical protein MED222_06380 [Vibrio sp. MED222]|nr:hypothetical protein MED222_06380 [Vibrio sp. MED222]